VRVIDSSALVKYFAREEDWERVRELILEGVITLDLAIKEVVTPSPHPWEALRPPPSGLSVFPLGRTHIIFQHPHSWGITFSGPGGLGSSGFTGAPSPRWLLSPPFIGVQTLNSLP
jgi:hypothetical protein